MAIGANAFKKAKQVAQQQQSVPATTPPDSASQSYQWGGQPELGGLGSFMPGYVEPALPSVEENWLTLGRSGGVGGLRDVGDYWRNWTGEQAQEPSVEKNWAKTPVPEPSQPFDFFNAATWLPNAEHAVREFGQWAGLDEAFAGTKDYGEALQRSAGVLAPLVAPAATAYWQKPEVEKYEPYEGEGWLDTLAGNLGRFGLEPFGVLGSTGDVVARGKIMADQAASTLPQLNWAEPEKAAQSYLKLYWATGGDPGQSLYDPAIRKEMIQAAESGASLEEMQQLWQEKRQPVAELLPQMAYDPLNLAPGLPIGKAVSKIPGATRLATGAAKKLLDPVSKMHLFDENVLKLEDQLLAEFRSAVQDGEKIPARELANRIEQFKSGNLPHQPTASRLTGEASNDLRKSLTEGAIGEYKLDPKRIFGKDAPDVDNLLLGEDELNTVIDDLHRHALGNYAKPAGLSDKQIDDLSKTLRPGADPMEVVNRLAPDFLRLRSANQWVKRNITTPLFLIGTGRYTGFNLGGNLTSLGTTGNAGALRLLPELSNLREIYKGPGWPRSTYIEQAFLNEADPRTPFLLRGKYNPLAWKAKHIDAALERSFREIVLYNVTNDLFKNRKYSLAAQIGLPPDLVKRMVETSTDFDAFRRFLDEITGITAEGTTSRISKETWDALDALPDVDKTLVVGRITKSKDPLGTVQKVRAEYAAAAKSGAPTPGQAAQAKATPRGAKRAARTIDETLGSEEGIKRFTGEVEATLRKSSSQKEAEATKAWIERMLPVWKEGGSVDSFQNARRLADGELPDKFTADGEPIYRTATTEKRAALAEALDDPAGPVTDNFRLPNNQTRKLKASDLEAITGDAAEMERRGRRLISESPGSLKKMREMLDDRIHDGRGSWGRYAGLGDNIYDGEINLVAGYKVLARDEYGADMVNFVYHTPRELKASRTWRDRLAFWRQKRKQPPKNEQGFLTAEFVPYRKQEPVATGNVPPEPKVAPEAAPTTAAPAEAAAPVSTGVTREQSVVFAERSLHFPKKREGLTQKQAIKKADVAAEAARNNWYRKHVLGKDAKVIKAEGKTWRDYPVPPLEKWTDEQLSQYTSSLIARAQTPEAERLLAEAATSEPASVPTMVTRDMRQQLLDLGYRGAEVDALTPDEAQRLIAGGIGPERTPAEQAVQRLEAADATGDVVAKEAAADEIIAKAERELGREPSVGVEQAAPEPSAAPVRTYQVVSDEYDAAQTALDAMQTGGVRPKILEAQKAKVEALRQELKTAPEAAPKLRTEPTLGYVSERQAATGLEAGPFGRQRVLEHGTPPGSGIPEAQLYSTLKKADFSDVEARGAAIDDAAKEAGVITDAAEAATKQAASVEDVLRMIEHDLTENAPRGALSPEQAQDIISKRKLYEQQFLDDQASSYVAGEAEAKRTFFDYRMRYKHDYFLDHLVPYHYWFQRFALQQLKFAAAHPVIAMHGIQALKMWQDENASLPASMRFSVRVYTMADGTQVLIKPLNMFMPLAMPVIQVVEPSVSNLDKELWRQVIDFAMGFGLRPGLQYELASRLAQRLTEMNGNTDNWLSQLLGPQKDAARAVIPQIDILRSLAARANLPQGDPLMQLIYGTDVSGYQEWLAKMRLYERFKNGEISEREMALAFGKGKDENWQQAVNESVAGRDWQTALQLLGIPGITEYSATRQRADALKKEYFSYPYLSEERSALAKANPDLVALWHINDSDAEIEEWIKEAEFNEKKTALQEEIFGPTEGLAPWDYRRREAGADYAEKVATLKKEYGKSDKITYHPPVEMTDEEVANLRERERIDKLTDGLPRYDDFEEEADYYAARDKYLAGLSEQERVDLFKSQHASSAERGDWLDVAWDLKYQQMGEGWKRLRELKGIHNWQVAEEKGQIQALSGPESATDYVDRIMALWPSAKREDVEAALANQTLPGMQEYSLLRKPNESDKEYEARYTEDKGWQDFYSLGTVEQRALAEQYSAIDKSRKQERTAFRNAHPEVVALWDLRDKWILDNPDTAKVLGLEADTYTPSYSGYSKSYGGRTYYTKRYYTRSYTSRSYSDSGGVKNDFWNAYNALDSKTKKTVAKDPLIAAVLDKETRAGISAKGYQNATQRLKDLATQAEIDVATGNGKTIVNGKELTASQAKGLARATWLDLWDSLPSNLKKILKQDPEINRVLLRSSYYLMTTEDYQAALEYLASALKYITPEQLAAGTTTTTGGGGGGGGTKRASVGGTQRRTGLPPEISGALGGGYQNYWPRTPRWIINWA